MYVLALIVILNSGLPELSVYATGGERRVFADKESCQRQAGESFDKLVAESPGQQFALACVTPEQLKGVEARIEARLRKTVGA